jgi:predicted esterase YcpF (UPF0227 family)
MMSSGRPLIIYIHGFNSSSASEKAQQFSKFCQESGKYDIAVPEVSHDPQAAVTQLEALWAAITQHGWLRNTNVKLPWLILLYRQ